MLSFVLAFAFTYFTPAFAQEAKHSHPDETTAQVPILTEFHEVIFKVWHTAWPEKNLKMLSELLPEILRDKQRAWMENTAKLETIVAEYERAASRVDSLKLLDAAERLHAQYEALVRVTRPVLKEMDAFHQVLYMLYHHYLPEKNEAKLVSSVMELKEKMAALEKAKLPDRLKKKEAAFKEARTQLARSVKALDASMVKSNPKEFAASVEVMHAEYQALERVFE
jgi:hypothetical protein